MNAPAAAPRLHPAVVISIVVAATAVTACALVAIAWMLGWVPTHGAAAKPAAVSAAPNAAVSHDLALLPGETVVNADEAKPVTPQYAKPGAEKPAEAPKASPKPPPPAQAVPRSPRPSAPTYQAAPSPPRSFERSARNFCVNCGTVQSITTFEMGEWDVRVRFEDGSTQTLRYRTRPPLRIGQSVLLEEGRLVPQ